MTHPSSAAPSAEPAPPALRWHDGLLLGHAAMDATHQAFVHSVQALREAGDEQLPALLQALIAHAEQHFGDEDRWMAQTDFPARQCHVNEHAAVMQSLHQVQALLAQGDTAVCRRLGDELARWFPGHADYLDAPLAHWLCKRRFGAAPVVLRRRLTGPEETAA